MQPLPKTREPGSSKTNQVRTVVAVDLGADSGRVAVGRFDGEQLAVEEAHRFPNVPLHEGGVLRWDFPRLRADVREGLRKAALRGRVDSVAVDSWAIDFGLLDRDGRLLENPVHYRDARRAAAFDAVLERIPARELYERTAIQLLPINTLCELTAMADAGEPVLRDAERLLLIPDLFHHWLCGAETTERTNATTTQCYDPHAGGGWARDLLERLGVPAAMLPEIVPPGTPLGAVRDQVEADTGLGAAQVVATATHDTASAVAAVPMAGDRAAYLSVGTWSLVGVESGEPFVDEAAFRANLTNEGGVEGTVRVLRNVTGLWTLQECRRAWAEAGRAHDVSELVELALAAPQLRSFVDPDDPLFAEPGDMPARVASYCRATGQEEPADEGATVRCLLESLALKHADTVDVLARVTGRELEELHLVGGGARNAPLCAWTAQASRLPVLAGLAEATAIGNILVQLVSHGDLASIAEGRELVRRSFVPRLYDPAPDPAWDEARARFAELAAAVEAHA